MYIYTKLLKLILLLQIVFVVFILFSLHIIASCLQGKLSTVISFLCVVVVVFYSTLSKSLCTDGL